MQSKEILGEGTSTIVKISIIEFIPKISRLLHFCERLYEKYLWIYYNDLRYIHIKISMVNWISLPLLFSNVNFYFQFAYKLCRIKVKYSIINILPFAFIPLNS